MNAGLLRSIEPNVFRSPKNPLVPVVGSGMSIPCDRMHCANLTNC